MSKIAIDTHLPNQSHTSPPSFKQPAVLYTIPQPVFRLISRLFNHYPVSRPIHRSLHQSPVLQPQDPAAGVRHPLIVAGHQHRLPRIIQVFQRLIIPRLWLNPGSRGSSARINSGSSSSARAMAPLLLAPGELTRAVLSTPARPSRRSSSQARSASAARFPGGRPAQARSAARSGKGSGSSLEDKAGLFLR